MKKLFKIISVIVLILLGLYFLLLEKDISFEEASKILADEQSQFVEIDGLNIHYKREGKGMPILLIHGTSSILQAWDGWAPTLVKNGYEVIRMDIPGFGLTGSSVKEDYSIEAYVEFIDAFTTALNIDSFHIAGSSLGGQIAWAYAIDYPQKLKKLILLDPGGIRIEGYNISLLDQLMENKLVSNLFKNVGTKYLVKTVIKHGFVDDSKITKEIVENYISATKREGNRDALIKRANTVDKDRAAELVKIYHSTLLLWGKEDQAVPFELAQTYLNLIPNSKLVSYKNVGHVPMEEIPQKSILDAISFLKE